MTHTQAPEPREGKDSRGPNKWDHAQVGLFETACRAHRFSRIATMAFYAAQLLSGQGPLRRFWLASHDEQLTARGGGAAAGPYRGRSRRLQRDEVLEADLQVPRCVDQVRATRPGAFFVAESSHNVKKMKRRLGPVECHWLRGLSKVAQQYFNRTAVAGFSALACLLLRPSPMCSPR